MATTPISQSLGPGSLKFGETGAPTEFAASTTKTELKPELSLDDAVGLLSGDDFQPEGTWGGSISGTFYQEYSATSLIAWCLDNAGKTLPFTFHPRKDSALSFSGKCVIAPVAVGGDAKKSNTTDFEFKLVGKPTMKKDNVPGK